MDLRRQLLTDRSAAEVFSWIDDLGRYPTWMRLTHSVDALPDDEAGPAWSVELRATLGPLARSKRLRMVRTVHQPPERVVFERHQRDGRLHSPWVLTVTVAPADASTGRVSELDMHLHYGGRLWTGGLMERVLADEVERGRARLSALLDEHGH